MQLTIPQRNVADKDSFPLEPAGVSRWLAALTPLQSTADAREIYRGLRHSNRLHNDLTQRRSVLACFIPALRELHEQLSELSQAQPQPLTQEFQQYALLLDGLLREEAFAFKILLSDSAQPRADDIRRALQAMVKQVEVSLHCYQDIDEGILRDANQLYSLAEEFSLGDISSDGKLSIDELYRYLMLLTLVNIKQHRAQQVRPLFEFLQRNVSSLQIRKRSTSQGTNASDFAVHLGHGARPVPSASLLTSSDSQVRWIYIQQLIQIIDEQLAQLKSSNATLLGSTSVDRQTLARLRVTLARSRQRRHPRVVCFEPQHVCVGLKAICAQLQVAASLAVNGKSNTGAFDDTGDKASGTAASGDLDKAARQLELLKEFHKDVNRWYQINQCSQGTMFVASDCRDGLLQVGDLVSIQPENQMAEVSASGKSDAMLGVVRWMANVDGADLHFGVEYLAKGVLPIGISRTYSDDIIADDALIIGRKSEQGVIQTILLPAYLYQSGDRLTATLNGQARNLILDQSLQSNGLFSHFSLKDAEQ